MMAYQTRLGCQDVIAQLEIGNTSGSCLTNYRNLHTNLTLIELTVYRPGTSSVVVIELALTETNRTIFFAEL